MAQRRRRQVEVNESVLQEGLLERMDAHIDASMALANLADWITKRTFLDDKLFSYKDHEYQIAIAQDTHPRMCTKKCSQVGLTELQVRMLLAYLATHRNRRALYGLPTTTFARAFVKDRVDAVIRASPALEQLLDRETDNVEQKLLGSSILYAQGLSGKVAGFSIPLHMLVVDELDLCAADVVDRMNSRLRHAPYDPTERWRGLKRLFGTPSLPKWGIDKKYQDSDQHRYAVKCHHCESWVIPEFRDLLTPGFDDKLENMEPSDVRIIDMERVKLRCHNCHGNLHESLIDPDRREWVATAESEERGYAVAPWDLAKYNTAPAIIAQRADYRSTAEYFNQVLGLAYQDATNSFLSEPFETRRASPWMDPDAGVSLGRAFLGVDTGKRCHVVVLVPRGMEEADVVYMRVLKPTPELSLEAQIVGMAKTVFAAGLVIDAAPEAALAGAVTRKFSKSLAAEYARSVPDALRYYFVKEANRVVKIDRTKMMQEVMKFHNSGKLRYPAKSVLRSELKHHFQSPKLVVREDASGTPVETFVKTHQEDHWVHALVYAYTAWEIWKEGVLNIDGTGVKPMVTKIRMKA